MSQPHTGGILFFVALLTLATVTRSACEAPLAVPIALDDSGRARIWSACPSQITIEIMGVAQGDPALRRSIVAALDAWADPLLPALVPIFAPERTVSEDGHNTLSFSAVSPCAGRRAERWSNCQHGKWQGLTHLYGRPAGAYFQTIEADIIFNQELRSDPTRMTDVLHHEIGHFYGLDHLKESTSAAGDSVMSRSVPHHLVGPGPSDRKALREAYLKACSAG